MSSENETNDVIPPSPPRSMLEMRQGGAPQFAFLDKVPGDLRSPRGGGIAVGGKRVNSGGKLQKRLSSDHISSSGSDREREDRSRPASEESYNTVDRSARGEGPLAAVRRGRNYKYNKRNSFEALSVVTDNNNGYNNSNSNISNISNLSNISNVSAHSGGGSSGDRIDDDDDEGSLEDSRDKPSRRDLKFVKKIKKVSVGGNRRRKDGGNSGRGGEDEEVRKGAKRLSGGDGGDEKERKLGHESRYSFERLEPLLESDRGDSMRLSPSPPKVGLNQHMSAKVYPLRVPPLPIDPNSMLSNQQQSQSENASAGIAVRSSGMGGGGRRAKVGGILSSGDDRPPASLQPLPPAHLAALPEKLPQPNRALGGGHPLPALNKHTDDDTAGSGGGGGHDSHELALSEDDSESSGKMFVQAAPRGGKGKDGGGDRLHNRGNVGGGQGRGIPVSQAGPAPPLSLQVQGGQINGPGGGGRSRR